MKKKPAFDPPPRPLSLAEACPSCQRRKAAELVGVDLPEGTPAAESPCWRRPHYFSRRPGGERCSSCRLWAEAA